MSISNIDLAIAHDILDRLDNDGYDTLDSDDKSELAKLTNIDGAHQLVKRARDAETRYKALFDAVYNAAVKVGVDLPERDTSGVHAAMPFVAAELIGDMDNFAQKLEQVYPLVYRSLFVAYVWNDHNFSKSPTQYAREEAQGIDINNIEAGNALLADILVMLHARGRNVNVSGNTDNES